jgi:CDP-diacylglycerol--serine O-phosphatidyltransferase
MKIKNHIPNFITCLNLLFGCFAIVYALKGNLIFSSYFVGIAIVCDFLDGLAARILKATSAIGKELDSLADVVSFGVAPGIIVYQLLQLSGDLPVLIIFGKTNLIPFTAFIIPVFAALRLAKFNIDERQHESFIGLPVPANALFFASLPLIIWQLEEMCSCMHVYVDFFTNAYLYLALIPLFAFLMLSNIPLFSLKMKNFNLKENVYRYLLVISFFVLFFVFKFVALPIIIILYIILSLIQNTVKK